MNDHILPPSWVLICYSGDSLTTLCVLSFQSRIEMIWWIWVALGPDYHEAF